MSIRTLLWAKEQTVITSTVRRKGGKPVASKPTPNSLDKLVLIGIADEASEHSWDALIGIEDLAVFAGCTRRAVQESLGRLERAGYIRCRQTKVESGQSGWQRIYLLSAESPLFRGLIEVDFDTVEQISRYQMRTFRDRHATEFVPSDSLRHRKSKSVHRQGEQGSHCTEGRVNEVHTTGANEVHTEGERGSHCEGERGSHPFSATSEASTSPDPEARARDGRTDESSITEEHRRLAGVIRSRLDLRRIDARPKQVISIEEAIAAALARGVGFEVVARHAEVKLREARTCRYFIAGFGPEHLPVEDVEPASVEVPSWCGQCDPEGRDKPTLRRIEDEFGSIRRCPRCHPDVVLTEAARNTA